MCGSQLCAARFFEWSTWRGDQSIYSTGGGAVALPVYRLRSTELGLGSVLSWSVAPEESETWGRFGVRLGYEAWNILAFNSGHVLLSWLACTSCVCLERDM